MIRRLSLRGSVGAIRIDVLEGREHVVMPVVALVEGVIHASNSPAPELVLAEEFSKAPQGWDGRPVMFNHPEMGGEKVSANEPEVLEKFRIGQVFHTKVENRKLMMEAWIDPARVDIVGDEAVAVVAAIRAGKMAEVSVGVFVQTEEASGEFHGKKYAGVWREIVADHLAILPEGMTGACDVDMGCGVPRAAAAKKEAEEMTLREKFLALVAKFKPAQEGMADSDIRGALDRALFASEPGYLGLVDVFQDDKLVIYAVAPDGQEKFLQRTFEIAADQTVTLGSEITEVKMVTKFEPITAASAASSGCGGRAKPITASASPKEETMKTKKERIAALEGKTCFTAAQMESLSDDMLKTLEEHSAKTPPAATTPAATAPAATTPATVPPAAEPEKKDEPLTEEKALAAFPRIKKIVEDAEARAASQKVLLVAKLKDAAKGFTEVELKAMPIEQLEKLAKSFDVATVDFTISGTVPRDAAADDKVPDAPNMRDRIIAMRAAEKKSA